MACASTRSAAGSGEHSRGTSPALRRAFAFPWRLTAHACAAPTRARTSALPSWAAVVYVDCRNRGGSTLLQVIPDELWKSSWHTEVRSFQRLLLRCLSSCARRQTRLRCSPTIVAICGVLLPSARRSRSRASASESVLPSDERSASQSNFARIWIILADRSTTRHATWQYAISVHAPASRPYHVSRSS